MLYQLNYLVMLFFRNSSNTLSGNNAKNYLYHRDYADHMIHEFDLGHANNNGLLNFLLQKDYYANELKVDLDRYNYQNELVNVFKCWIMISIRKNHHVVGFSGQDITNNNLI